MDDQVPPPVIMPRPVNQGPIPVTSEDDMKRQLWLSYNQGYNEGFTRGYNTAMKKCSTKPPRSVSCVPISTKYAQKGRGDFVQKPKPHYNHFSVRPKKQQNIVAGPVNREYTHNSDEYPPLQVVFKKNSVNTPPGFHSTVWTKPSSSDQTQQW